MDKKVDLHIHTYASDGEWSGKELIEHLDEKNIKVFAVTDHDEIGAIDEVEEIVSNRGDLTFIKGVEISVVYKNKEHHILTYGVDQDDEALIEVLKGNQLIREDYNKVLIDFFHKKYPQITIEDYRQYDFNPYQGGWKALCYLRDKGIVKDISDYFDQIKDFTYAKKFKSPEEMLAKLKNLGYTTILAHPPAYTKGDLYEVEELDYWRELGIDGFECYTRYLTDQSNANYYVEYCNKHNMMITGGSDCHGGFIGRSLGDPEVRYCDIRFTINS